MAQWRRLFLWQGNMSERIQRVTAPNPGIMTGNGTNSYVLKAANGDCMIVDPGPDHAGHIDALLAAAGGPQRICRIVLTHMHPDHSPAAMPLARLSAAPVCAAWPLDDEFQDKSCRPDQLIQHGQMLTLGDLRLRCVHTPGHVDNHFCFLLENEGVLFTGDHLMQGSTVVIIPPHGNMKKYLASLALLKDYAIKRLAPGHGEWIDQPLQEIDRIIRHRLAREDKLLGCLAGMSQPATLEALVLSVYDDVDPALHAMASLSLLAHLLKLEEERRAERHHDGWRLKS